MNEPSNEHETMRRTLRAYLLDTLDASERQGVEERVAGSEEWREALEAEREALGTLDLLPEISPPRDLTAKVLDGVRDVEAAEAVRRSWVPSLIEALASVAAIVALIVIILPALGRAREAARRAGSESNMKQLGLVFRMYASESKGELYPPPAPYPGIWTFDVRSVYPKYVTDPSILVNPALPNADELGSRLEELLAQSPTDWEEVHRIVAMSYTYPGWVMGSDADVEAFHERYGGRKPEGLSEDLNLGNRTLFRPREGIERFFISDINNPAASSKAQADIPVLFETVDSAAEHAEKGCNVLYMDGHVEFIPYGVQFPVTDSVREAFPSPS